MEFKNKFSVGIVTYGARFDPYFKPLLKSIKDQVPSIEVLVMINGDHNQLFDQDYRRSVLNFILEYENVYPFVFTAFRSLSKLWNNTLINSTNDSVLVLNDDVSISPNFWENLDTRITESDGKTFTINSSWSHFLANRKEVDEVGWFDERLLGVGAEDADFSWRYGDYYNTEVLNIGCDGIQNHYEKSCERTINQRIGGGYSQINDEIMQEKYFIESVDENDYNNPNQYGVMNERRQLVPPRKFFSKGGRHGMMNHLRGIRESTPNQYPSEDFFWKNKHLM